MGILRVSEVNNKLLSKANERNDKRSEVSFLYYTVLNSDRVVDR